MSKWVLAWVFVFSLADFILIGVDNRPARRGAQFLFPAELLRDSKQSRACVLPRLAL